MYSKYFIKKLLEFHNEFNLIETKQNKTKKQNREPVLISSSLSLSFLSSHSYQNIPGCCIYKKQLAFGESSSEESEDECDHCYGHVEIKKKNSKKKNGNDNGDNDRDDSDGNANDPEHNDDACKLGS